MRTPAQYYIYRNLHTKTFSLQYKGRVIYRPLNFIAYDCSFIVSESGRQKVIETGQKNVHAKIACRDIEVLLGGYTPDIKGLQRVFYSPYITSQFEVNSSPIFHAEKVVGILGMIIYTDSPSYKENL